MSDFTERRPGGLWRGCREPVPLDNAEDEAIFSKNSPDDRQCINVAIFRLYLSLSGEATRCFVCGGI